MRPGSMSFSDHPPPSYEEAIATSVLNVVDPPQPANDHAYVNVCDNQSVSESEKPIIPVLSYIGCLLYIAVIVIATLAF